MAWDNYTTANTPREVEYPVTTLGQKRVIHYMLDDPTCRIKPFSYSSKQKGQERDIL